MSTAGGHPLGFEADSRGGGLQSTGVAWVFAALQPVVCERQRQAVEVCSLEQRSLVCVKTEVMRHEVAAQVALEPSKLFGCAPEIAEAVEAGGAPVGLPCIERSVPDSDGC
jgi:hypothetical protein